MVLPTLLSVLDMGLKPSLKRLNFKLKSVLKMVAWKRVMHCF